MPGGGAEVFSTARARHDRRTKLTGADYIDVHRAAHQLGIRSNCTMLYGHVETAEDRVEHLDHAARPAGRDRRLPRPTSRSRITPTTTSSAKSWAGSGTATTGFDDLKNLAVGRLFLDNFAHVKSHWIMVTPSCRRSRCIRVQRPRGDRGAREDLSRGRRARPQSHDARRAAPLIRGAGKVPAERDSFYQPIRTDFSDLDDPARARPAAPHRPSRWCTPHAPRPHPVHQLLPVYGAIDRGIVPGDARRW